ncbi:alpha/beta hydrolase [Litorivivens sp.]|uniref:alpha/beta hydrolase n=1 Tax=Litorivivens sp. TaxID=2020868 RepID=UPI00356AE9BC
MPRLKRCQLGLISSIILLTIVFVSGPRLESDIQLTTPELPESLEAYLRDSEARFSDITPGTEKTIVWAGEPETKTDYVVVYLHGFSATRQETAPVAERIAAALDANVYSTRFTGHGRDGNAMLEGSLSRWLNDTHEAMSIGRRLGEKIILLGVSTGGTAAAWAALNDSARLSVLVLMSPNFGPKDERSMILTWPWGKQIARLVLGPERNWTPHNEAHARYWTTRYPTDAILPMMAMVKTVHQEDLSTLKMPSLWIYSENDQVLNVAKIDKAYAQVGSTIKKKIIINDSGDPNHHVLAGEILSPSTVTEVVEAVVAFVKSADKDNL